MLEMKVLLSLLWLGADPVLSSVRRLFWYEPKPRTWEEARQYCRSTYGGDLATVLNSTDLLDMQMNLFHAWFGLKKVNSDWQWVDQNYSPSRKKRSSSSSSSGENVYNIMNAFAVGEPNNGEECGRVTSGHSKAYGDNCDDKYFIFCESTSYIFLPEAKTWAEGLRYCRSRGWQYMDFPGIDDFFFYGTPIYQERHFPVWIGLHRDGGAWNWSDGALSDYRDWDAGANPGPSPDPGSCVAVSSQSRSMSVRNCSEAYPFLCYRHNLVLVPELLTWEEALETCRTLSNSSSYRLLSLEERELVYVMSYTREVTTSKVWVGLRFLAGFWFWSDSCPLTLLSLPLCPEPTLHCGALVLSNSSIEPCDCSQRLNAFCYEEP